MRRAYSVRQAGQWDNAAAIDRVVLDASERHRRRLVLTAERGTTLLLDLPHATTLKDGDGLVLDDSSIVRVVGRPEPLVEITAASGHDLARLGTGGGSGLCGNGHHRARSFGRSLRRSSQERWFEPGSESGGRDRLSHQAWRSG